MREYFLWIVNIVGSIALALVFIFISIKAFGQVALAYNDAFIVLVMIASAWIVFGTVQVKLAR